MIDRQRPQVAAVDADDPRAGVDGARELVGVVHFDQRRPAPAHRASSSSCLSVAVVERGDNQQHGVRARRRRFEQLVLATR